MLKSLVILVLLPLGAAAPQSAAPTAQDSLHPIGLDEAVSLAQRNNPLAVQARGQTRTAASSVRSAWGSFIPSLTASMSQNKRSAERFDPIQDRFVSSTQPWNYSTGLSTGL
jgi:outer membrane protein TolC